VTWAAPHHPSSATSLLVTYTFEGAAPDEDDGNSPGWLSCPRTLMAPTSHARFHGLALVQPGVVHVR
jgi:hypothetical protein